MMTGVEIVAIRESFLLLEGHTAVFAAAFYKRLFEHNPNLRILFYSDLGEQSKKLMRTLILVNTSLEHFHSMRDSLRRLGKRHASYGVRPEYYAIVGSTLVQTMEQFVGPRFDTTMKNAWTKLLARVSGEMLHGANETGIPLDAPTADFERAL